MAAATPRIDRASLEALLTRKRWRAWHVTLGLGGVAALAWSADAVGLRPAELARGVPAIGRFLGLMLPPDVRVAPSLWKPALETIYMAIWGVLLGTLIGLPLGILGAANVSTAPVVAAARVVATLFRSISELIWALLFVTAVGLGPFPGALALGMNYGGIFGKLHSEAMEGVDPGPVEALVATGASRFQTIVFSVFPQVLPQFVTYNLYFLEVGVRSATVLGIVGAGGIGFELMATIKLYEFRETAAILLVILVLVTVMDLASGLIRRRIYG